MTADSKPSITLANFDTATRAEEGVWMYLQTPDGARAYIGEKPIRLKVLGRDSKTYRQYNSRIRSKLGENMKAGKQGFDEDEARELDLDLYSACLVGWENLLDSSGEPVAHSPGSARELLAGYPVIFEQVIAFVGRRENFVLASKNS